MDERGGPVVGATVRLWAGRGRSARGDDLTAVEPLPQTATTGPDGAFRFEAAAETGNRIRVEAPGLATVERTGMRGGALARPVTLGLGQVIRGTVVAAGPADPRDRRGRPLRGPQHHALDRGADGRLVSPRRGPGDRRRRDRR